MDAEALTAALSALAGPECLCAVAPPEVVTSQLFPAERDHIVRAVPKRQAEFGTARVLARRLLAALDVPAQSLVPNADRSPAWPVDVVGSISHCPAQCAVVVSRARGLAGIGVDLETGRPINAGMRAAICSTDELAWLESQPVALQPGLATLVFSAKESFYKCQYPLTRTQLGFHDVALQFDLASFTFRAASFSERVSQPQRLRQINGRWVQLPHLLMTLATLRPDTTICQIDTCRPSSTT